VQDSSMSGPIEKIHVIKVAAKGGITRLYYHEMEIMANLKD
jgi:hypothetical protein